MNTPSPCDKCKNCYYNVLEEDDPNASAECKLELVKHWGDPNCPSFDNWKAEDE